MAGGIQSFGVVFDPSSFDDFNPNESTVGAHYRRRGPSHLQQRKWFTNEQSMIHGPYDPVDHFNGTDAFVNQADEIDRHRKLLDGARWTPEKPSELPVSSSVQPAGYQDVHFAHSYFHQPLMSTILPDPELATSPATTYLDHSMITPPVSTPRSGNLQSPESYHAVGPSSSSPRHKFHMSPQSSRSATTTRSAPVLATCVLSTSPTEGPADFAQISERYLQGLGAHIGVETRAEKLIAARAAGGQLQQAMTPRARLDGKRISMVGMLQPLCIVEEDTDGRIGS